MLTLDFSGWAIFRPRDTADDLVDMMCARSLRAKQR